MQKAKISAVGEEEGDEDGEASDTDSMLQWREQMRSLLQQHNKNLCDTCLTLFWKEFKPMNRAKRSSKSVYLHVSSAPTSEDSEILPGCCLCSTALASLAPGAIPTTSSLPSQSAQFRLFTHDDDILAQWIPGRSVDRTGNGPDLLRLVGQWVDDCSLNHTCCELSSDTSEDPPLPTRVIDIGLSDTDIVRLFVNNGTRGKWAALSYRWGDVSSTSKTMASTTVANLKGLQDEIPSSLLSATFLDAFQIARSLGLRYIWIDRLCILQDSDSDWIKEAARMPFVYQNAHVTISAGAGKDGASGIFGNRHWTGYSRQVDVPLICEEGISNISFDFDTDLFESSQESDYLSSRAWCFQEAQLSRRRVIFDREQTSFMCVEHGLQEKWQSLMETSPYHFGLSSEAPKRYGRSEGWHFPRRTVTRPHSGSRGEEKNYFLYQLFVLKPSQRTFARKYDMLWTWYVMITDYSGRDLTFPNDRLVAIAGVAELVGQVLKDQYVAGMWKSSLPESLFWSPHIHQVNWRKGNYETCSRFNTHTAPSWSWASICGKVWFSPVGQGPRSPGGKVFATILDVSTDADPAGPYGPITTGYMRIRGPLRRGYINQEDPENSDRKFWSRISFTPESTTGVHCIFDISSEHPHSDSERFWCLQTSNSEGLVLIQISESEQRYSRVGIFTAGNGSRMTRLKFMKDDIQTIIIV